MEEFNMSRRPRREFTEEFKLQMVKLYNSGKPTVEIVKEYDLTRALIINSKTNEYKLTTLGETIIFQYYNRNQRE